MGKTRDLFKKIKDTKGTFHAKMSTIKNTKGMHLTEAEGIQEQSEEYTEKLYKKVLMIWITTMVWSLTQSQTSWNVKSSGPQESLLGMKLMEVMEFQLNYSKP